MIKGFIFDLDGVLVDTPKLHFEAWRKLANSLGIDFNETQNEQLKGIGRHESLNKILDIGELTLDDQEFETLCKQKNEWYQEMLSSLQDSDILPGAQEFLKAARNLNLQIALGSASQNAQKVLDLLRLTGYFDVIIDGNLTAKSKPHPQVFQMAASKLQLAPQSLVVFEDSIAGIEAANTGGFRSIGIGRKKVLSKAELVFKGLNKISPGGIINQLNFKR